MAYRMFLTLKSRTVIHEMGRIYRQPTPNVGDVIEVEYKGRAIRARVTGISTKPPKTLGTTAHTEGVVSAEEV